MFMPNGLLLKQSLESLQYVLHLPYTKCIFRALKFKLKNQIRVHVSVLNKNLKRKIRSTSLHEREVRTYSLLRI